MNTRKVQILTVLIVLVFPLLAHAEDRTVFRAKVVRIEPGMPIKISCGVALVTRLAEYEVEVVYQGHVDSQRVIVRHLACNGNELDDLRAGDHVFVVATTLKTPEKHFWRSLPVARDSEPELIVRFNAVEVAKQVYPTQIASLQP